MAPGSVKTEMKSESTAASATKRASKRPQSLVEFLSEEYPLAAKSSKRQRREIDYKWKVVNAPPLPHLYSKEATSINLFDRSIESICDKIVDSVKAVSAYGNYDDQKVGTPTPHSSKDVKVFQSINQFSRN